MKEFFAGPAHVAIYTKDIEESVAFYEKLGGTTICRSVRELPEGPKYLALVDFGGMPLELTQCPYEMPFDEGVCAHYGIYVTDIEAAAAAIRAAGVDTFTTPAKRTVPELFGGHYVWFFVGPSGEQIELMQKM